MSYKISRDAQTAMEWCFGAYADKDLGIPFDIILSADCDAAEPSEEQVDVIARNLVGAAVHNGLHGRLCLGWCTYLKEGRFGLGVLALRKTEAKAA